MRLRNNKASGESFISNELLKCIDSPHYMVFIAKMFNYFGKVGLPPDWNILTLKSIYKNRGEKNNADNYRGISVMGALPKLYSTVLNLELENIAIEKGLRADNQSGFRKGFRVEDNGCILKAVI